MAFLLLLLNCQIVNNSGWGLDKNSERRGVGVGGLPALNTFSAISYFFSSTAANRLPIFSLYSFSRVTVFVCCCSRPLLSHPPRRPRPFLFIFFSSSSLTRTFQQTRRRRRRPFLIQTWVLFCLSNNSALLIWWRRTCFYNSLNNFFVSVPFVLMRVRTFEKISVLMSLHTLGQAEGCYYFQTDTSFLNWVSQIWKIEMNFTRYIDFENYQIIQIFNTIYISGNGKINWCFIRAIKMRSSCNLWCSFLLKIKVA